MVHQLSADELAMLSIQDTGPDSIKLASLQKPLPDAVVDALHAESVALRAAGVEYGLFEQRSRGALHPNVQPKFYVGSLVLDPQNAVYRICGRSIAADGTVTYSVEAVDIEIILPDLMWLRYDTRVVVTSVLNEDRIHELAEDQLTPLMPVHLSLGEKQAKPAESGGETAMITEGSVVTTT